ncbi:3-phosphoshikimate 1-carboxyvinyltransferase [Acidobacteriota bacterium]
MKTLLRRSNGYKGVLSIPPDKSISHRAAIMGSLASGDTIIKNPSFSEDCSSTLNCLQMLGTDILRTEEKELILKGKNLFDFTEPKDILNAQNSGTTARLLMGLLSGQNIFSVISGDPSLQNRPMKRVVSPLRKMGARIEGRRNASNLPIGIQGQNLNGIKFELPVPSAQLKSAIILAGLLSNGDTEILEPIPTRDHTERMLKFLGAPIERAGNVVKVQGRKYFSGQQIIIPGDFSSACFFIAAALIVDNSEIIIPNAGVNPTRTGFLRSVKKMGAIVHVDEKKMVCHEPTAVISASTSELEGIEINPEEIPSIIDEIPLLALLATQAMGKTEVSGAAELRVKESDRIQAIVSNLRKMGVEIEEKEDGFIIEGPQKLKGAVVDSFGDHRIAMTMAIAGLVAEGVTKIDNFECHRISFHDFDRLLAQWVDNG